MANMQQKTEVIHYPRLDTVFMVEDAIKKAKGYPTKAELLRSLPKKMMYQTFCLILDYLVKSNKVLIDSDGSVVWVFADNPKIEKLLKGSVRAL